VARHGAQNALENWTSVARWPSGPPSSAGVTIRVASEALRRIRPLCHRQASPVATATASTTTSAMNPGAMLDKARHRAAAFPAQAGKLTSGGPLPAVTSKLFTWSGGTCVVS